MIECAQTQQRCRVGLDEPGVAEPDEREQKTDARRRGQPQARRDRQGNGLAQRRDRDHQKQHAGPEPHPERGLPGHLLLKHDREGDALLAEAARLGIVIETDQRVTGMCRSADGFELSLARGVVSSRAVVIATGGRSLPKTGSDGLGYDLVRGLGHGHIDTMPALAPLVLDGRRHESLAGVSHAATLSLRVDGRIAVRLEGSLLWTHFGMSGPVVLNLSRHWHRATLDGANVDVLVNLCPGETFESLEAWWLDQERERPRARADYRPLHARPGGNR